MFRLESIVLCSEGSEKRISEYCLEPFPANESFEREDLEGIENGARGGKMDPVRSVLMMGYGDFDR